MKRAVAALVVLALVGCQTEPYRDYANALAAIAQAKASVQIAQAAALKELAYQGDATSKTVAIIMLGLGGGGAGGGQQYQNPAPPQNEALQWAQVLLPTVATLGLGYWGYRLGVHQSDNSANVSIAGYGAMQGIAQSGFNAVGQFKPIPFDWSKLPVTNQTTTTTTNNIDNRDGNVIVGTGQISQDNSPVVVVPPVVQVVPVVVNP